MSQLSIVIPAYNEEKTLGLILDKIKDVSLIGDLKKEIIIINDCSSDNTEDVILKYQRENLEMNIKYVKHEKNLGKGAAIHSGIKIATGDYLIIQDADLEYDPKEYNDLLIPLLSSFADVVYGSRFMGSNPHRILYFWHAIGNKFLTFFSDAFTNINLTDMETCYKIFKIEIINSIKLREKRLWL